MKHIVFFMSAVDVDERYTTPSLELIRLTVQGGYGFIFGGSQTGMMKRASDEARKYGAVITAVTCKLFLDKCLRDGCEKYVAEDIPERKRVLIQKSDMVVALPGGSGTFDEITDAIEAKKFGVFVGPILLLNTGGFWNGMIEQYRHMYKEGFLGQAPEELFIVEGSAKKAAAILMNHVF